MGVTSRYASRSRRRCPDSIDDWTTSSVKNGLPPVRAWRRGGEVRIGADVPGWSFSLAWSHRSDYDDHMAKSAAVAEIKAHLSHFLRRVKAGEEIVITERNVPIARIVPLTRAADETLRALDRQGLVRIGSGKLPRDFWKRPRGKDEKGLVRAAVAEEREEGW
jgi:prevent-host-death family protein